MRSINVKLNKACWNTLKFSWSYSFMKQSLFLKNLIFFSKTTFPSIVSIVSPDIFFSKFKLSFFSFSLSDEFLSSSFDFSSIIF